jgi:hypothetical protein
MCLHVFAYFWMCLYVFACVFMCLHVFACVCCVGAGAPCDTAFAVFLASSDYLRNHIILQKLLPYMLQWLPTAERTSDVCLLVIGFDG